MINSTSCLGIVPGDILIKTALEAGMADLRNNPFLLDYCFGWVTNDDLTSAVYGEKERQKAKEWFLNNEIAISMNFRAGEPRFPMITISLESSSEAESTLADIHYDTSEEVSINSIDVNPKPVLGPFTPSKYDPTTGLLTFPGGVDTGVVFKDMVLVDVASSRGFKIKEVIDSQVIELDPGINASFSKVFISPIDNFYIVSLESCEFRQTYSLRCLCGGDALYVLYLEQILTFILMRYKEILFEGRGFERSTISTGPVQAFKDIEWTELIWCRDISLTGYVRHYWPKVVSPKINGILLDNVKIIGGGTTPPSIRDEIAQQGWDMELDPF